MFHGGSKKTLKKRYYSVKQKIKLKKFKEDFEFEIKKKIRVKRKKKKGGKKQREREIKGIKLALILKKPKEEGYMKQ